MKKPVGDFKKKKVKVGRKVKRENVTKITVKSKGIQVPLQAIRHVATTHSISGEGNDAQVISQDEIHLLVITIYILHFFIDCFFN